MACFATSLPFLYISFFVQLYLNIICLQFCRLWPLHLLKHTFNPSTYSCSLSSTLAAAVEKTMQDRMVAGGLISGHDQESVGSIDRCKWIKAAQVDICPWPNSTARAERCMWSRNILKKPNTEWSNSGSLDD